LTDGEILLTKHFSFPGRLEDMSNLSRRAGVALLAFATASLFAQSKPNFTGEWKLNKAKSDLGEMADRIPDSIVVKIDHKDPELITSQPGRGGAAQQSKLTTDGKETTETAESPNGEVKSSVVAKWEGNELAVNIKREMAGHSMTQDDRWALSEDGKTLTISRKLVSPTGGALQMKQVFEKV
jgi:hypothetical protein